MCSTGLGTVHWLNVHGQQRCYDLIAPSSAWHMPVLIMHHGMTGNAAQFCNGRFAGAALSGGFALVCTAAIGGYWQFGSPTDCDLRSAPDLAYVSEIIDDLKRQPARYDSGRIFQAGFSQGALFSAYSTFCLERDVVGFGQAGSSYGPMKIAVLPTTPPLRACVWCNRDDSHCHPMDSLLIEAGHSVVMSWSDRGGHNLPRTGNGWLPAIVDCAARAVSTPPRPVLNTPVPRVHHLCSCPSSMPATRPPKLTHAGLGRAVAMLSQACSSSHQRRP